MWHAFSPNQPFPSADGLVGPWFLFGVCHTLATTSLFRHPCGRRRRRPHPSSPATDTAEAARREPPLAFLDRAREIGESLAGTEVEVLGPAAAPMERRAGLYRAQLLLHAPSHGPLQRLLARALPALEELPEARRVRWSLDVDPLELF